MPKKTSEKNNLNFINNEELKKTIEDSIDYIEIIFEQAKNNESALYKEETYRVIILYVVSIIEAILLYILETRKEKIDYTEYKYINEISPDFKHCELPNDKVVIAVQKKRKKEENSHIGFVELVKFMKEKDLITKELYQKILDINNIRNIFHFTKPRNKITCEIKAVDSAFKLLVEVIEVIPKIIKT